MRHANDTLSAQTRTKLPVLARESASSIRTDLSKNTRFGVHLPCYTRGCTQSVMGAHGAAISLDFVPQRRAQTGRIRVQCT